MVAVMTDLLELKADDVVLEIGTGLGYQSAVLAELAGKVYTVEVIDELALRAVQRLKREGYNNIEVRVGNGYFGWPEHAPFDKVIVTATPRPHSTSANQSAQVWWYDGDPGRTAQIAQQLLIADKDVNGEDQDKKRKLCRYCSRCSRDPTRLHSGHLDHDGRRHFGTTKLRGPGSPHQQKARLIR